VTADEVVVRRQGLLADWSGRRPVPGCEVTYAEVRDERNRARASDVRYVGAASAGRPGAAGVSSTLAVAALFFTFLVGLLVLDELPVTMLGAYGLFSAVAFLTYGADKSAAVQGRWRTSESTLHALALVGGWPGALIAQQVFRHKTTKQPFRTIFWFTVVANCVVLAWFLYEDPSTLS